MPHKPLQKLLDETSSYPSGTAGDWRERYTPLIAEGARHNERPDARVSVIVVAWQAADYVVECLDHIRSQQGFGREEIEIILVDNGGLEPVRDELAARADLELRMVGNVLPSRGRNAGAAWASAPLLAYIDEDGLVASDYFDEAVKYFENPNVLAIRGRVVAKDHPYFTTLASHYDRGQWPVEDCLITEGNCVVRREPFFAVGGFAEALFGHEGIELTSRLKRYDARASVLYVPDVVMRHDYFDGWEKFFRKSLRYAGMDDAIAQRGPALAQFMDSYFSRDFSRSPRPADEIIAGAALGALRTLLGGLGRLKASLSRSSS